MGQKSNILTLRTQKNFINNTLNANEIFNSEAFIKALKRSFDKKGVLITSYNHTDSVETAHLSLEIFLKSAKLLKLRKKVKRLLKKKHTTLKVKQKAKNTKRRIRTLIKKYKGKKRLVLRKKRIRHLTFSTILKKCLKNKLVVINVRLINKREHFVLKASILKQLIKFKRNLFSRRFNLFYDFIKLSSLFIRKEIDINTYCNILGSIFRFLPKRSHGKYFLFIKTLISTLIRHPGSKIKGIKVLISGKLKGKLRASIFKTSRGEIEIQTISANNDLSKTHIHTLYGAFGLTMWVNYVKEEDIVQKPKVKKTRISKPKEDKVLKPKTKKIKKNSKVSTTTKVKNKISEKKPKKVNISKKIKDHNDFNFMNNNSNTFEEIEDYESLKQI